LISDIKFRSYLVCVTNNKYAIEENGPKYVFWLGSEFFIVCLFMKHFVSKTHL